MAMRIRKLFPAFTEITNDTVDCSGFCEPACPYNCYPYADYDVFLSPPPPPVEEHQISPYVIIVIVLLATFFLIVSYYAIASKSCADWCGLRTNRQPQIQEDNAGEEFLDEDRVDHPIWFITTSGLQQSIINSISICRYKKGEGLIEGTECSVCLSEFQQDETLRLLPKCNHAFHISCIDTWLRSHINCPLCRAHIVSDATSTGLVSLTPNPALNSNNNFRIENSENDGVLANSLERNELHHDTTDRAAEADATLQPGEEIILKDNGNSNQNGDFQVSINHVSDEPFRTNGIKPVWRSSSTDSLTAATMCFGLESQGTSINLTEITEPAATLNIKGRDRSSNKPAVCSSIEQCLHKTPVPMKRSNSCGGRFFSSRQNRSLNSILPS